MWNLPDKFFYPSEYKIKMLKDLNEVIVNTFAFAPEGFFSKDFHLGEHQKLYGWGMYVLEHEDATEEDAAHAYDVLLATCYGHVVGRDAGETLCEIADELGYKEAKVEETSPKDE